MTSTKTTLIKTRKVKTVNQTIPALILGTPLSGIDTIPLTRSHTTLTATPVGNSLTLTPRVPLKIPFPETPMQNRASF